MVGLDALRVALHSDLGRLSDEHSEEELECFGFPLDQYKMEVSIEDQ